jgi:hypothetical protein
LVSDHLKPQNYIPNQLKKKNTTRKKKAIRPNVNQDLMFNTNDCQGNTIADRLELKGGSYPNLQQGLTPNSFCRLPKLKQN